MAKRPDPDAAMRALGIEPGAGKALGVVLPGGTAPSPGPGGLVVAFEVPGRPVPWKAPMVLRSGVAVKDRRLAAWQQDVAMVARAAMGGRRPYSGPVELRLEFRLARRAGTPPDTSNLAKALEDSLQGAVIENDRQVGKITSRRRICGGDGATVEVYGYEG